MYMASVVYSTVACLHMASQFLHDQAGHAANKSELMHVKCRLCCIACIVLGHSATSSILAIALTGLQLYGCSELLCCQNSQQSGYCEAKPNTECALCERQGCCFCLTTSRGRKAGSCKWGSASANARCLRDWQCRSRRPNSVSVRAGRAAATRSWSRMGTTRWR